MPAQAYRIRIRSHLDDRWTAWFDDLAIQHEPDGVSELTGVLQDQSALFGTLMKIRDLGLTLLSVEQVDE